MTIFVYLNLCKLNKIILFRSPEEELEVTSPENKYNLSLSERVMNRQNKTQVNINDIERNCLQIYCTQFVVLISVSQILSLSTVNVLKFRTL